MGQAGCSEEADGVLPLCATTWGDDKLLRAAFAGRRGGPPPSHGWRGRTRLMAACHFGRLPRVLLLLSNGEAVNNIYIRGRLQRLDFKESTCPGSVHSSATWLQSATGSGSANP
jgi:hypothetical protein